MSILGQPQATQCQRKNLCQTDLRQYFLKSPVGGQHLVKVGPLDIGNVGALFLIITECPAPVSKILLMELFSMYKVNI